MIIHFFKASIPPSSLYSIHPFLQNHPGGKYLVRQGIESFPSPKQQRRHLPCLLSLPYSVHNCILTSHLYNTSYPLTGLQPFHQMVIQSRLPNSSPTGVQSMRSLKEVALIRFLFVGLKIKTRYKLRHKQTGLSSNYSIFIHTASLYI